MKDWFCIVAYELVLFKFFCGGSCPFLPACETQRYIKYLCNQLLRRIFVRIAIFPLKGQI